MQIFQPPTRSWRANIQYKYGAFSSTNYKFQTKKHADGKIVPTILYTHNKNVPRPLLI